MLKLVAFLSFDNRRWEMGAVQQSLSYYSMAIYKSISKIYLEAQAYCKIKKMCIWWDCKRMTHYESRNTGQTITVIGYEKVKTTTGQRASRFGKKCLSIILKSFTRRFYLIHFIISDYHLFCSMQHFQVLFFFKLFFRHLTILISVFAGF